MKNRLYLVCGVLLVAAAGRTQHPKVAPDPQRLILGYRMEKAVSMNETPVT